ncbi:MAG TPA: LysR family transcriptional regulator [Hydrogenophaga sp.]|uniref:LysR family transcriptional regulator n=1 Tax=Hydrogenophaga sp. TaxID=1904254 RepID=UPI002BF2A6D9|nr:LysR family transcriptional regulator [Hydrogenophaga sp.]HMN94028.1 LysR family transcriptional regulator [Hydrogenophaga sp.]HMP12156.1 LysR family transcriptional regulator [Hydrogenophaga sp.]
MNYRHLYYFWVVAKEGGFARAAERLDMAIQTISAQVKALEQDLGHQLLKPAGRKLALTEAGQSVFVRAEAIFQLGESIPDAVAQATSAPAVRLAVGMSDGLSKLASHSLLRPVLGTPALRLTCHEGEVEQLMSELALHQLDLVLACQPPAKGSDQRLTSDRLMVCPVDWYGPAAMIRKLPPEPLMASLARLPLLLPTGHTRLRERIERWFEAHQIAPQVVGEFEDSALMALFASQGMGVFPLAALGADRLAPSLRLRLLGRSEGLYEEIHGIRSRRGLHHPLVMQILSAAAVHPLRY